MQKRAQTLLIAGVLLAVTVIVATRPAAATPPVSWNPPEIQLPVVVGEDPLSIAFTVTSIEDLGDVEVRVVSELESFVTVSPDTFTLDAGQTVELEVVFAAADLSLLGSIDGVLQIRAAGSPPKTHAQPLPLVLDVQPFPLPPDPGEAGLETLEGVDSDGDGVRDDVQRWIVFRHPEDDQVRGALFQQARAMANVLLSTQVSSGLLAQDARRDLAAADNCLSFVASSSALGATEGDLLIATYLNTTGRSDAYITYNHELGGRSYDLGLRGSTACEEVQ